MREEAGSELIVRAKWDRAAFGDIYDFYLNRVYAFCLGHSSGREEAEDLTAQTFERALVALPRYDDRGIPFSVWLLRIAANAAVDRARRGARVGSQARPAATDEGRAFEEEAVPARDPGPDEWAERWERARAMRVRLAALPDDQRRALHLRYVEDRPLLDIAAAMGRSEGAVKQLLQRGLKALRSRIQEEDVYV